jgi:hypothetical protein
MAGWCRLLPASPRPPSPPPLYYSLPFLRRCPGSEPLPWKRAFGSHAWPWWRQAVRLDHCYAPLLQGLLLAIPFCMAGVILVSKPSFIFGHGAAGAISGVGVAVGILQVIPWLESKRRSRKGCGCGHLLWHGPPMRWGRCVKLWVVMEFAWAPHMQAACPLNTHAAQHVRV